VVWEHWSSSYKAATLGAWSERGKTHGIVRKALPYVHGQRKRKTTPTADMSVPTQSSTVKSWLPSCCAFTISPSPARTLEVDPLEHHVALSHAKIRGDNRALGLEQEEDLVAVTREALVVSLALGQGELRLIKAPAKILATEP